MNASVRKKVASDIAKVIEEGLNKEGKLTARTVVEVFQLFHKAHDEDKGEIHSMIKYRLEKQGLLTGSTSS